MDCNIVASVYDETTGEILFTRCGQKAAIDSEKRPYVLGDYVPSEYYIDVTADSTPPTPKLRPQQQTKQNTSSVAAGSSVILSALPEPCTVLIAGQTYSVPDGVLEWSTEQPGVYPISIKAFPYLDWQGEVEVTEVTP